MLYATAVIGAPLVMWVLCLGCGLAVERLLRIELRNALLLPLGLCVAFVLVYPGYVAGIGDWLAIALLGVVTITGLVFAKGGLRSRLNPGWAGLAGLAAYVLYMLPVIVYGHWTWTGYDFVNDTSFEMMFANHIKTFGTTLGNIPESSERQFLVSYLNSAYPLGTQSLLGTLSGITFTDVAVLYQGFVASLAAIAAIALASATRRLLDARRAALVGFVAAVANLTYQYAMQGDIKEIGLMATICVAVALARETTELDRPYAAAALLAIAGAAALATYNVVAVPYLGSIVLLLGIGVALTHRRLPRIAWAKPLLAGACLAGVLSIPSLETLPTFFQVAQAGQGSTGVGAVQMGQLLRVLPISQISGVWLSGEYRVPIVSHTAGLTTAVLSVVILATVIPAVLWALWRRDVALLIAAGTVALILLVAFPRVSPYAQGKLLAISSPLVVVVALAGLLSLRGRMPGLIGLAAAGVISLAIVGSDLLAYAHTRVAPTSQIEAIRATGNRFAGKGLVLWNEFEEYAKYFAHAARISAPFAALTPQQVQLRQPTYFYGHYFDLDQELLSFVEGYPIIVTRRSPAASRPPANYKRVYENSYYEAWQRTKFPKVLEHVPLQYLYSAELPVDCSTLAPVVEAAPKGSRIAVALPAEEQWFEAAGDPTRSGGWVPDTNQAGAVLTTTGGHAEGYVHIRHGGRFAVWAQGDFPRPAYVEVDGRQVGSVSGSNTPDQWLQAASIDLKPGRHLLRIVEESGHKHFGPGEWGVGTIGGVAVKREVPERVQTLPLSRYQSLCGKLADWVEIVRP